MGPIRIREPGISKPVTFKALTSEKMFRHVASSSKVASSIGWHGVSTREPESYAHLDGGGHQKDRQKGLPLCVNRSNTSSTNTKGRMSREHISHARKCGGFPRWIDTSPWKFPWDHSTKSPCQVQTLPVRNPSTSEENVSCQNAEHKTLLL